MLRIACKATTETEQYMPARCGWKWEHRIWSMSVGKSDDCVNSLDEWMTPDLWEEKGVGIPSYYLITSWIPDLKLFQGAKYSKYYTIYKTSNKIHRINFAWRGSRIPNFALCMAIVNWSQETELAAAILGVFCITTIHS